MAALHQQEKHHYIAPEKLRDKYIGYIDRVKSLTRAIESSSRTRITVEQKRNNTIEFVIIGGINGVDRALNDVKYEFEKGSPLSVRVSRAKKAFLSEGDQRKLQQEGKVCLLTAEALHRHDILTGATELRQFACLKCNHPWWKQVSRTKPVSTCNSCRARYNALDRDKEFGIGRYICEPCEHTFYAWCEATELKICYTCKMHTGPPFISPRFKAQRGRAVFVPDPSRLPTTPRIILHASTPHLSTGSTISSSAITVDLGSDISVSLDSPYLMETHDFSAVSAPLDRHFEYENGYDETGSLAGEFPTELADVGDLEMTASQLESTGSSDFGSSIFYADSEERTEASDSSSDETSEVDPAAPGSGEEEAGWPSVGDSG